MSWQGQISTMVRHMISDVDSTNFKYDAKRLETAILVSAQLVTFDTTFSYNYTINVEKCLLNPDPTAVNDTNFIALTTLKTACVILGSEVRAESGNAISIKDGPSAIDLSGVSNTLMILYKDLCQKYEQMLLDYQAGGSLVGHAILGPFSPGSDNIRRIHSDPDRRGGYFSH